VIYDVYGFYQYGFVKVMESLEKLKLATSEEVEAIARDKSRRQNFDQVPLGEIKAYTELELRKLSLAAIKLRDGFDYMGIRLGSWSGAGAAAAALIRARGVSEHYAGWVNKRDPSPEQLIAHASYYGGHIELLKQGYSDAGAFVYDIRSAYPAEMQDLPSMIGGRVRHWNIKDNPLGLDWREVETSSKISAFFIRWRLPPFYVDRATGKFAAFRSFPCHTGFLAAVFCFAPKGRAGTCTTRRLQPSDTWKPSSHLACRALRRTACNATSHRTSRKRSPRALGSNACPDAPRSTGLIS
jgi:hypothetical protein